MDGYNPVCWMGGGDYVYGNDCTTDPKAALSYYYFYTDPAGHTGDDPGLGGLDSLGRSSDWLYPSAISPGNHENLDAAGNDTWMGPAWQEWTYNYRNGDTNFYDDGYIGSLSNPYEAPGMTASYFANRVGDQRWIVLNTCGKDDGDGSIGMNQDLTVTQTASANDYLATTGDSDITFTAKDDLHVGDYVMEDSSHEIVKLTSNPSGNTFNVSRAQCGTAADTHPASAAWRVVACVGNSRQANWFSIELARWHENSDTTWLIVALHNPLCYMKASDPWAEGEAGEAERNNIIRLCLEYGVDLVLQGDHHTYARYTMTAPNSRGSIAYVLDGCASMQDPQSASVPDEWTFSQNDTDTTHRCCTLVKSQRDSNGVASLSAKTIGHTSGSSTEVAVDPASGWTTIPGCSPQH